MISGEQLQRSGVRFLSDVFRMVPGLEVTRTTSTDSNVSARGYGDVSSSAQGILSLLDGRQVYNEFFGNTLWDGLPVSMDDVEKIEVIRGPGSFLHGPNAMHGLVNVVTRSPLDYERSTTSLSAAGGSYHSATATLTDVRRDEHSALKTTLAWDDVNRFTPRDGNAKDKKFLELRWERQLADEQTLEVTGGTMEHRLDLLIPTVIAVPPAEFDNDIRETFLRTRYEAGDLRATTSWTHFDSETVPDQLYAPFDVELDTVDVDLQYSFPILDRHTATVGTGYRRSTFRTEDQDVAEGRHAVDLGWAFVQDEFRATDQLFFTAGLRLDTHSKAGVSLSPRLAAVWEFRENHSLRASAGAGFRNPSLRELWFDLPVTIPGLPGPVTIEGNDRLDAELMRSFEVGYYGIADRLEGGLSVYYNLIDDLVVFEPVDFFPGTTVPSRVGPDNQVDEEAYGTEVEGEYRFLDWLSSESDGGSAGGLFGFANYSYGIVHDRDTHDRVITTPRHKANAGLRLSRDWSRGRTQAMFWVHYFDDTRFETGALPDYTLLSGQISHDFHVADTAVTAYVQAFNLLDRDHREHPQGQKYGQILMGGVRILW